MGRSSDEKGAEKAVAIRRSQQKERARLQSEIAAEQKTVAAISEERAPIAAEVRKVEAEVGPIKYIAKFIYGDHGADENMLEKAVTWIIILIVVVFDPLAVIMLLAAQMTFGWHRRIWVDEQAEELTEAFNNAPLEVHPDEGTVEEVKETVTEFEGVRTPGGEWIQTGPSFEVPVEQTDREEIPSETPSTALGGDITAPEEPAEETAESELDKWNKMIEEAEQAIEQEKKEKAVQEEARKYHPEPDFPEGRLKPDLTEVIESEESKKKTYMIKDPDGNIQIKSRE
jgi:hypothetical protein